MDIRLLVWQIEQHSWTITLGITPIQLWYKLIIIISSSFIIVIINNVLEMSDEYFLC